MLLYSIQSAVGDSLVPALKVSNRTAVSSTQLPTKYSPEQSAVQSTLEAASEQTLLSAHSTAICTTKSSALDRALYATFCSAVSEPNFSTELQPVNADQQTEQSAVIKTHWPSHIAAQQSAVQATSK
jgi:hypothetical protein